MQNEYNVITRVEGEVNTPSLNETRFSNFGATNSGVYRFACLDK